MRWPLPPSDSSGGISPCCAGTSTCCPRSCTWELLQGRPENRTWDLPQGSLRKPKIVPGCSFRGGRKIVPVWTQTPSNKDGLMKEVEEPSVRSLGAKASNRFPVSSRPSPPRKVSSRFMGHGKCRHGKCRHAASTDCQRRASDGTLGTP